MCRKRGKGEPHSDEGVSYPRQAAAEFQIEQTDVVRARLPALAGMDQRAATLPYRNWRIDLNMKRFQKGCMIVLACYIVLAVGFYWIAGDQLRYQSPVSYTHLDVYKRQVHAYKNKGFRCYKALIFLIGC